MADSKKILKITKAIDLKMEAEKEYLTGLDQPIGDSDHGVSMAREFATAGGKLPSLEGKDIGTIPKTMGMTLISTAGDASGPLYGSAYVKTGVAPAGEGEMDMDDLLSTMGTVIQAVGQRSKATVEEATMLDVMAPSLKAVKDAAAEGKDAGEVLEAGARAIWTGAEHTKDLVATKGRASYVEERGLRHQDPGAASYSYMSEVIAGLV